MVFVNHVAFYLNPSTFLEEFMLSRAFNKDRSLRITSTNELNYHYILHILSFRVRSKFSK